MEPASSLLLGPLLTGGVRTHLIGETERAWPSLCPLFKGLGCCIEEQEPLGPANVA